MALSVAPTDLKNILPLRKLFLQENNFQIRYDACHTRGWTDSYALMYNEEMVGYGSVKGKENINDRDTVFEFYLIPSFRNQTSLYFEGLLFSSSAAYIECQSNDLLLTHLLYQYGKNIDSDVVLFEEGVTSSLVIDEAVFRRRNEKDIVFEHKAEPVGDYILEFNKEVVATGGFLLHYNMPFADLYMEVREDYRRKGLGSFLIQEIKKQCYLAGRVPAARTSIDNAASRATLTKAGLRIAGFMLVGCVRNSKPPDEFSAQST
ncbi:MAG: GNAT family N-acetyltransferase [Chitinophagaceae bacterium]|nr:GNAT family N-acetyltransferase [Chitinophagaceae bacterium]